MGSTVGPSGAAVSLPTATSGQVSAPVALVVHRRLAESSYAEYERWQAKVGSVLAGWPGFLDRQVIPPDPPHQVDWVVVQRFVDVEAARGWLQSDQRAQLAAEISDHFIGNDDVHLVREDPSQRSQVASVLISSRVAPELEDEYLAWQRRISAQEARLEGFLGHKIERPIPGVQENWTVVLSFDTDEHLQRWLDSDERKVLLQEGERFNEELTVRKASYGFGFWSGDPAAPDPVFKSNLIVLMMLYPVVFLWGYFIADPLFASHGVPFWLSLFIGNLVSTQLLGWFLVPWAFRRLSWWTRKGRPIRVEAAGYAIIAAVYVISMAVYAWMLSW